MAQVKEGDKVKIDFTGTLEDGTVFDSTMEHICDGEECGCEIGPMEVTVGAEDFFPQIEAALIGLAPGEKVTVTIPAEDAFGEYDEEQVFTIGNDQVPAGLTPEVGQELEFTDDEGESVMVTVVEITEDGILLDANHPLAGENITYNVELVEIL